MNVIDHVCAPSEAPLYKRFRSARGEHLLVVPHSRLFDLSPEVAADFDIRPEEAQRLAGALGETGAAEAPLDIVVEPSPQSLSLNVSSACNLACSYCYADKGAFGGKQADRMKHATAIAAVDRLLTVADPAQPVTIGFLGGEPLLNRALIHSVVLHASRAGKDRRLDVRFSITTNGTTLLPADIDLFRAHPFAVTVSIDGDAATQDAQRPDARGRGTFARLAERLAPLLAEPGHAQVAARLTVTGDALDLATRLSAVYALGFSEAGVAPLRTAKDDANVDGDMWQVYLDELVAVARSELARARSGRTIRLTNLAVALKQIHAGASSPYPCGAGGGYFSVAADGHWYACHRAIGDDDFILGNSESLESHRRRRFLTTRHVHAQKPCNTCWARYLCSGSCHQEAGARTEAGCDFIRGWLTFCLAAYCELVTERPDHFVASYPT
jgi:uncharacterized protein